MLKNTFPEYDTAAFEGEHFVQAADFMFVVERVYRVKLWRSFRRLRH